MAEMSEVERLLRSALVPVDPPGGLTDRLEETLAELAGAAAEELADWELAAMRDPRNWVRPVSAAVVGGVAGGALLVLRVRQRQRRQQARGLKGAQAAAEELLVQTRKRLERRGR